MKPRFESDSGLQSLEIMKIMILGFNFSKKFNKFFCKNLFFHTNFQHLHLFDENLQFFLGGGDSHCMSYSISWAGACGLLFFRGENIHFCNTAPAPTNIRLSNGANIMIKKQNCMMPTPTSGNMVFTCGLKPSSSQSYMLPHASFG